MAPTLSSGNLSLVVVTVLVAASLLGYAGYAEGLLTSRRRPGGARRRMSRKQIVQVPLLTPTLSRPKFRKRKQRSLDDGGAADGRDGRRRFSLRLRNTSGTRKRRDDNGLGGKPVTDGLVAEKGSLSSNDRTKSETVVVSNVHELRSAVLDQGIPLRDIEVRSPQMVSTEKEPNANTAETVVPPFDHEVLRLISERASTRSTPGFRAANDTARLALAIEGGGMRGAVSAGMASAIACLGLCDAFDAIYGSSAGSVVGAYMVSRQMNVDVYTDVLPAAKRQFVCTNRLVSSIVRTAVNRVFAKTVAANRVVNRVATRGGGAVPNLTAGSSSSPGMNISFLLDEVMSPDFGLRPLDLESFRPNDVLQPLRIVSSAVREGKMETVCFGSEESDFFDKLDVSTGMVTDFVTTSVDGTRHGLFACLEAGMKVPAATGPPVSLIRSTDGVPNRASECFDAFCYEPIPYRSAVEEGATHVLALRSQPDGFEIKTKPTVYDNIMAPNYFNMNGLPQVASFFKKGGQQYIYLEDILTLDEGMEAAKSESAGHESPQGVAVPPAGILYGAEPGQVPDDLSKDRSTWKRAYLLPVTLPRGTKEMSALSQDKDEVLRAVREGFAVAFDLVAPAAGVDLSDSPHLSGARIAELVFPKIEDDTVLSEPARTPGEAIEQSDGDKGASGPWVKSWKAAPGWAKTGPQQRWRRRLDVKQDLFPGHATKEELSPQSSTSDSESQVSPRQADAVQEACRQNDATTLLSSLPGIQSGKLPKLAEGLRHCENR